MLIYIVVFVISIFFTRLCEGTENKYLKFIFACFAVAIPSILAGVRDSGVGHDTLIYADEAFEEISSYRDKGVYVFLKDLISGDFLLEPLFCILNYIGAKFGTDIHYGYLVVNTFTVGIAFKAIYDYREKASMPLMMFVFLFLFYNVSYNIMRQCLALVLALNLYNSLESRKWLSAILWGIGMLMSHSTAVVFFLFLLLYWAIAKDYGKRLILTFVLMIPFVLLLLDPIIMLAVDLGIVPEKMLIYLASEAETAIFKTAIVYGLVGFGLFLFQYRKLQNEDSKEVSLMISTKLFAIILLVTSVVSVWAFRMTYYFLIFDVLFIPRVVRLSIMHNRLRGRAVLLTFVSLIIVYWYWSIIHNNENETYPYKSEILSGLLS